MMILKKRDVLVDELFQQIDDAQIENEGLKTFRRLTRDDVELIELMQVKGEIPWVWFQDPENEKWKEAIFRRERRNPSRLSRRFGSVRISG
jgi:hypothetical protein